MYLPRQFAEDDPSTTLSMVRAAGFGHLVVAGATGFEASPVPFVVDDGLAVVRVHVARPNPIWRLAPCDALLAVPVSDAYVSPGWYPSKTEHGRVVPTWNYEVVYFHGSLVAHDDDAWIAEQMRELTDLNEADMQTPWSVDDPPDGFVETTRRGTVGLELHVTRVESKRKLSQNRSVDDARGATEGLSTRGVRGERVATAMIDAMGDATTERERP